MNRTGIIKAIHASYTNVKKGDNVGYPYIDKVAVDGVYITGDNNNNDVLRNTVKLCINRLHKIGMTNIVSIKEENNIKLTKDEFIYKVLDMFQNCGMNLLAEEVIDYIGDTRKFTFELVYKDDYYPVENHIQNYHIYIKLRQYYWTQVDNALINGSKYIFNPNYYSKLSLGERMLEQLNEGVPNVRKGRSIHNYLDDPIYLEPPRLRRTNRYTGPPDYGVPVGLDGKELDIFSIEVMDNYYDACDKIVVVNEDDHPITKQIKERREQCARDWADNYTIKYYAE